MPTNKKQTLLAGLMVAGLSLGTLACSDDDGDDGGTETTEAETETTDTTAAEGGEETETSEGE